MYDQTLTTDPQSKLTLTTGGTSIDVDLYSPRGLELVAGLWLKLSAENRLMYQHSWLGIPIIQLPGDIVAMQELIWRLRPDFIVECGFAHGGSAVLYASILELLGKGNVIGVDVEVRTYNRVAIEGHPLAHRIRIVEASSIEASTGERVERLVSGAGVVMVVLDSNHTRDHVERELELYHRLVTPGSYLVVMDGAQAHVWDTPRGKPEWREDNPLPAIASFCRSHPEFADDPHCTRAHVTSSPQGFLRRRRAGGRPPGRRRNGMRIAVTGAGSFIGAALHRYCETHGIDWVGVDVAPPGPLHAISADISGPGWEKSLPDGVDAIVHLAAISRDADCRRDPARAIAVNLTGTWNVIAAARARGIRQIVFASSEWVYGDVYAHLKNEDATIDAASLRSEYPLTKLAGERFLWMAAQTPPALAATVLRFGIVYGPRPGNWSAVESMYDAVGRRDRVEVGSLDTSRRFIHVDDIAAGIGAALGRAPGFELFNLTGNRLVTLGDIIGESVRLHGRAPEVDERTPGRASIRNIDNSKAKRELGWEPRVELRQGLESLAAAVSAAGEEKAVRR